MSNIYIFHNCVEYPHKLEDIKEKHFEDAINAFDYFFQIYHDEWAPHCDYIKNCKEQSDKYFQFIDATSIFFGWEFLEKGE